MQHFQIQNLWTPRVFGGAGSVREVKDQSTFEVTEIGEVCVRKVEHQQGQELNKVLELRRVT